MITMEKKTKAYKPSMREMEQAILFFQKYTPYHGYSDSLDRFSSKTLYMKQTKENMEVFNHLIEYLEKHRFNQTMINPSGSVQKHTPGSEAYESQCWSYRVTAASNMVKLLVVIYGSIFNFAFGFARDEDPEERVNPFKAFNDMARLLKKHGIDLRDYEESEERGLKTKLEISKPMVAMKYNGETFEHCYHIDIRSAYPYELSKAKPEFKPAFEEIFEKKSKYEGDYNPYKAMLNYFVGMCQSWKLKRIHYTPYGLSKLSKAAINGTVDRLIGMSKALTKKGFKILGYNTDGIWLQKPDGVELYHDGEEGSQMGNWRYDYSDVTFRSKSAKCYEFKDKDGKVTVRMSGHSNLDDVKPRDQWDWGDIFKASATPKMFKFNYDANRIEEFEYEEEA